MGKLKRNGGRRWPYVLVIIALLSGYAGWSLRRSLPALAPSANSAQLNIATGTAQLSWPAAGQSAVGIVGSQILDTHGNQTPVPTASTAKLITALAVLHVKPLALSQPGPTITLTAADEALFNAYATQGGSLVKVQAGEQISEYQVLQTMMLPSANNMADSLAIWAFGSLTAYTEFANRYVQQLGLSGTHIGSDASGFAPSTTSTAHDLARLGELAMQNPVLAQIVGQSTATGLPVVNTVKNVNWLLGTANIIGVKTGNTDQAGGVYVSASRITVNAKPVTIVTAVAGATNLPQAMKDSLPLIRSAQTNFRPVAVIKAGSIVGRYRLPWGGIVPAIISHQLTVKTWSGDSLHATIKLLPVPAKSRAGQIAGSLTVPESAFASSQSTPVRLGTTPTKPTIWWGLTHPL